MVGTIGTEDSHEFFSKPKYFHDCRRDGAGATMQQIMFNIAVAHHFHFEYAGCRHSWSPHYCKNKRRNAHTAMKCDKAKMGAHVNVPNPRVPPDCLQPGGNQSCRIVKSVTELFDSEKNDAKTSGTPPYKYFYNKNQATQDREILKRGLFHNWYTPLQPLYRKMFAPFLKDGLVADQNTINVSEQDTMVVAVHLRRGDVSKITHQGKNGKGPLRYTTNAAVLKLLDGLGPVCSGAGVKGNASKTCRIHIFAMNGKGEDLNVFRKRGYQVHLADSEEVSRSWYIMSNADVFLMAKSSFSYVPALLSDKMVIYTKFWHVPLPQWAEWNELSANVSTCSKDVCNTSFSVGIGDCIGRQIG